MARARAKRRVQTLDTKDKIACVIMLSLALALIVQMIINAPTNPHAGDHDEESWVQ